jgi:hypothetical protein
MTIELFAGPPLVGGPVFFADQVNWAKAGVDILPKESVFPAHCA